MEFLTNNFALLVGGGSSAIVLWALKLIPNNDIQDFVGTACYWAGSVMTLGLGKWSFSRKIWNKTVEPYLIDLVDNVVSTGLKEFIKGLRSDK